MCIAIQCISHTVCNAQCTLISEIKIKNMMTTGFLPSREHHIIDDGNCWDWCFFSNRKALRPRFVLRPKYCSIYKMMVTFRWSILDNRILKKIFFFNNNKKLLKNFKSKAKNYSNHYAGIKMGWFLIGLCSDNRSVCNIIRA